MLSLTLRISHIQTRWVYTFLFELEQLGVGGNSNGDAVFI